MISSARVSGKDLVKAVKNLVYEEKQVKKDGVDLTIKEVYEITGGGSLDFGGSEYAPAEKKRMPAAKEPGEKYGWWHLTHGTYLITLNETVEEGSLYIITPHPRLLKAGATHPVQVTLDWKPEYVLPLRVGKKGLNLKENARTTKLYALEK